ncbi:hypothetical protein [Gilvimarinus chinensis]|uniref:hypothetical protein n=1 Tax=Gilvimarinus chinensis TaxID=396005 RepID=UPI000360AC26|nr:hypothetical protein [Gilvimarinus chinensis]
MIDSQDVKRFRQSVADKFTLNITDAQKLCAEWAKISHRNWQQWESGERRRINEASWELVHLKFKSAVND